MTGKYRVNAPVSAIEIPENRLRELRDYSGLAESMSGIGLLQPITVTEAGRLVAGRHRLEAAKSLGWKTIPAFVVADDDLANRLQEIDENLKRLDLTVWEQSKHAEERERVLEALGRRARRGDNRHSRPATAAGLQKTTEDVAKEAGMSERSWRQRVKIGKSLGPETRAALDMADPEDEKHRNFLNSTTQLNTVADISNKRGDDTAAEAVERVLSGERKNIYDAYPDVKREAADPRRGRASSGPSEAPEVELPPFDLPPERRFYKAIVVGFKDARRLDLEAVLSHCKGREDAERQAEALEGIAEWAAGSAAAFREKAQEFKRGNLKAVN